VTLACVTLAGAPASPRAAEPVGIDLVAVPGGAATIGDPDGDANETPRQVRVGSFRLMRAEATNARFAEFVAASGHLTDPERRGFGYVWDGRWRKVEGANWRRPQGPGSDLLGRDDHPVVQISQRDAAAFCRWLGLRLPSEEEWEVAARGRDGRRYPWGDAPPRQAAPHRANFGSVHCCAPDAADGFAGTAPVGRYPDGASPFGLLDMAGNVWEWTGSAADERPGHVVLRGGGWGNDAYGLRVSYRHTNPPDIGLDMVGVRCAADAADAADAGGG